MTTPSTREISGRPSPLPLMLKAALPAIPGLSSLPGVRRSGSTLPEMTLTRHDVPIDREHVAAYSEVCGFALREMLPLTYPHLLAFPLHLTLMTDRSFPFPAIGTVHLENSITQHRPISAEEALQVTVRPERLRSHPKGRVFDLVTDVHSAGELVWQETSTFLRRGRSGDAAADSGMRLERTPPSAVEWQLGGNLGRRYAAVAGDHNPIHLYGVTAKAFGFPRQIAHGMWSKARCVAMLASRLPDAVTIDVAFKKPVLLPSTVAFGSRKRDTGDWAFSLSRAGNRDDAPHLLGRTTAL